MAVQAILSQSAMLTIKEIKDKLRKLNADAFHDQEICPKCEDMGIPRYHLKLYKGKRRITLEYIHRNKIPTPTKNYKTNKIIDLYPRCYIGELITQAQVFNDMTRNREVS